MFVSLLSFVLIFAFVLLVFFVCLIEHFFLFIIVCLMIVCCALSVFLVAWRADMRSRLCRVCGARACPACLWRARDRAHNVLLCGALVPVLIVCLRCARTRDHDVFVVHSCPMLMMYVFMVRSWPCS